MALQIRRGLQANLPSSPAEGELLYATDTGNLYIGVSGSPTLISFGSGSGNSNVSAISDLSDVGSVSGIADGQALLWNAANSQFEYGTVAGSYGDSDVLSLLGGNVSTSIIPDANVTYDLGSANYRFRDLWLSGSTIQLGNVAITNNGNGTISFGSAVMEVNSGNVVFQDELTTANTNMKAYVDALENRVVGGANISLDSLAEVANALANSNTTLSTVAFTGNYPDLNNKPAAMSLTANSYLTYDGANIDLTTVVGQAGPKGDTGNTGPQGVSVSSAALTCDNLILTLSDASTIDAGNVRGEQGPQGAQGNVGPQGNTGADGVSVSSASVTGSNLIITLSDASTIDAGNVVGPQGAQGIQGDGNAGISSATVNGSGNLILTLADTTTVDAGNVRGEVGAQGNAGVGITSTSLVGGNLVLNYSNTSTQDVGNIQGPQGDQGAPGNTGPQGVSVSSATITGSDLILTLSDSSTINAGNVVGPTGATGPQGPQGNVGPAGNDGADGIQLSNLSVTTASASGSGALSYNDSTGVFTFTPPDLSAFITSDSDSQTLSILGNVITISGSGSTVDLTSAIASGAGGGSGIADLSGNTLSDLGDVSSASPTDGQALVWDNGNSVWAPGTISAGTDSQTLSWDEANSNLSISGGNTVSLTGLGGGGSSSNSFSTIAVSGQNNVVADSATDTLTFAAGSGISITTNATSDTVTIAATGSGGGGGGAVVERFKLNYATNGNLDSTTDLSSGISSVTIDSATSGEVSITFSGYNYPPASVMIYGYDYANNKYYISHVETTMATREIEGGGSSGSPTLFNGASTPVVKLRLRETETGASRSFGTTTHAWIHIVMYD